MRLKSIINRLFPLLGLPVVGYFFWQLGTDRLVEAFTTMGWGLIPLLFILPLWLYVVHAIGWGFTMSAENRRKLGWFRLSALQTFSYGISGMIPLQSAVAEPLKLTFLRGTDYDKEDFAASLVIDNTINAIAIFLVAAAGLSYLSLFLVDAPWLRFLTLGLVLFFCVLFSALIILQKRGLLTYALGLVGRIPMFTPWRERHIEQARRVDETIGTFYRTNRSGFYAALFLHVLEKAQGVAEFWLIFQLLGLDVSWGQCFFIFSAASTLDNLLFFAQVGGMEVWVSQVIKALDLTAGGIHITAALFRRLRMLVWAVIALALIGPTRRLLAGPAAVPVRDPEAYG